MKSIDHLKMRHKLLKDLVEDTERINTLHHDIDHDLLRVLKKEKLELKDEIQKLKRQIENMHG